MGPHDLDRLVERVWLPSEDPAWPVLVTTGELPAGHREVASYAIGPGRTRPRYLLPTGARQAVAAAFTTHLSTPSSRARQVGRAIALAWRSGVGELAVRDRLTVGVDDRVADERLGDFLLTRRIADELGVDDLVAVIPVRRSMPNAKPTARLLDHDGRALGYLKVGWSEATRELVANETAVLHELGGAVGDLRVPRVLASGSWEGLDYLVASPLPPVGPLATPPEQTAERLLAVAAATPGGLVTTEVGDGGWAHSVRERLRTAVDHEPEAAVLLGTWLDQLADERVAVRHGRWHGDWVPWNLGSTSAGPVAWDWEYSAPHAPLGFDLVHWHFQRALSLPDAGLEGAARLAEARAAGLARLGVPAQHHEVVVAAYEIEMLTRATHLAALGAGWNPKIGPALAGVVRERLTR